MDWDSLLSDLGTGDMLDLGQDYGGSAMDQFNDMYAGVDAPGSTSDFQTLYDAAPDNGSTSGGLNATLKSMGLNGLTSGNSSTLGTLAKILSAIAAGNAILNPGKPKLNAIDDAMARRPLSSFQQFNLSYPVSNAARGGSPLLGGTGALKLAEGGLVETKQPQLQDKDFLKPQTQEEKQLKSILNALKDIVQPASAKVGTQTAGIRGATGGAVDDLRKKQVKGGLGQVAKEKVLGILDGTDGGQDDTIDAKVSPGEYMMDAETVSALGDGNTAAGAKKLDKMRHNLRKHKRSAPASKIPPKAKEPMKYMGEA